MAPGQTGPTAQVRGPGYWEKPGLLSLRSRLFPITGTYDPYLAVSAPSSSLIHARGNTQSAVRLPDRRLRRRRRLRARLRAAPAHWPPPPRRPTGRLLPAQELRAAGRGSCARRAAAAPVRHRPPPPRPGAPRRAATGRLLPAALPPRPPPRAGAPGRRAPPAGEEIELAPGRARIFF